MFLPANVLLFQTPGLSRQGALPLKSDQLHHFASNGQLCKETKPECPFSMVTTFFLESHTKDCCDQPTESHGTAEAKGSEPGVTQTRLLQQGLLFESGAQVHEVYSCSEWRTSVR